MNKPPGLSSPFQGHFGSPLGSYPSATPRPRHPRQELPACLVLTPDPLTPALAWRAGGHCSTFRRYLLSWGDLRSGELEK